MDIQDAGAIGEILGALAVFLTLGYLAVQVRHSRRLLEENRVLTLSQVYQSRASIRMENLRFIASDEAIATLLGRVEAGGVEVIEQLTPTDMIRLRSFLEARLMGIGNMLYQHEIGVLDAPDLIEETRESITRQMPIWEAASCRIPALVEREYRHLVSD